MRSTYPRYTGPRYGIDLSEMAQLLRVAARAKAIAGDKVGAAALRAQAARTRSSIIRRQYRVWPPRARGFWNPMYYGKWSLARSAGAIRRRKARWKRLRLAHRLAWKLGGRRLLGLSCVRCGKFLPGEKFKSHRRNSKDQIEYVDRRCLDCKWGSRAKRKREEAREEDRSDHGVSSPGPVRHSG